MKNRLRRALLASLLVLQVFFYPMTALAAAATPATDASTEAPSSDQSQTTTTATDKPTGPEASTYIHNPITGLWENDYYTWNPTTKQTSPKTSPTYSYNPNTGMWDTTEYRYDTVKGIYVPQQISTAQPPMDAAATTPAAPPTLTSPADTSADTNTTGAFDLFYNNNISNNIASAAHSGDASVTHNTTGGDATSGNAASIATVMTLLQSTFGLQPGSVNTFTSDIYGTSIGDIHLDPNTLHTGGKLNVQNNDSSDVVIDVDQNNRIANNINLLATSGSAAVGSNTTGGDATSGNALAVANVVNMINSSISTGQSFIGNLNIYGDLDGDVLMPDELKQQLLSNNTPTTTIDVSAIENSELVADITTNSLIKNSVDLGATTGNATVSSNTNGGNATSGNASTNLTVLNLTGQQVIGSNALLVFVNVMGKWVGAIMNAPAGTTAATLGGQDSSMTARSNIRINGNITSTIENTINVQAASGDALVTNNTTAGNAKSGDATASANLLNIANTSFSLSDWFGILFINVFGTWHGSFGVDTAAGGIVQTSTNTHSGNTNGAATSSGRPPMVVFSITPDTDGKYNFKPIASTLPDDPMPDNTKDQNTLATTAHKNNTPPSSVATAKGFAWPVTASLVAILAGLLLMGLERYVALRRRHRQPLSINNQIA